MQLVTIFLFWRLGVAHQGLPGSSLNLSRYLVRRPEIWETCLLWLQRHIYSDLTSFDANEERWRLLLGLWCDQFSWNFWWACRQYMPSCFNWFGPWKPCWPIVIRWPLYFSNQKALLCNNKYLPWLQRQCYFHLWKPSLFGCSPRKHTWSLAACAQQLRWLVNLSLIVGSFHSGMPCSNQCSQCRFSTFVDFYTITLANKSG